MIKRKFKKEIKAETKYWKEHPEEATEQLEFDQRVMLRTVCGDCPDFYKEDCPRNPMGCEEV